MGNKYTAPPKKLRPKASIIRKLGSHEHYFCISYAGKIEKRPVSDPVPKRTKMVFKSMQELADRFSREQLDALLSTTFKVKIKPSADVYEAAKRVWAAFDICKDTDFTPRANVHRRRDKLGYAKTRPYRFARPQRTYSPKARPGESEKMDFYRKKLGRTELLILEIIEGFGKEFVEEHEILAEMERREDEFKSKQSLYRLFRYYRGPLRDVGFIMFGN